MTANCVKDHTGKEYPSESAMCKAWGVIYTTYYSRKKRGLSLKECLTKREPNWVTDFRGQRFPDNRAMCDTYGIPQNVYWQRMYRNWDQERALTTPLKERCDSHSIKLVSNVGFTECHAEQLTPGDVELPIEFIDSQSQVDKRRIQFREMCKSIGVNLTAGLAALQYGWGVEDAINGVPEGVKDYRGRVYASVAEMCASYGIDKEEYCNRIKRMWPQKEALLTSMSKKAGYLVSSEQKTVADHKGNKYNSKDEMCEFYRVPKEVVEKRISNNWTLEEALETPVLYKKNTQCKGTDGLMESIQREKEKLQHEAAKEEAERNSLGTEEVVAEVEEPVQVVEPEVQDFKDEVLVTDTVKQSGNCNTFFAKVFRMKYIDRWALMRNVEKESVSQHTTEVAILAHALATIGNVYFNKGYDCNSIAVKALFHDVTEVVTGDMPTPIKYANDAILKCYKEIETEAADSLINNLPEGMRWTYEKLLKEQDTTKLVKAADTLAAYLKSCSEVQAGNQEFTEAKESLYSKLMTMRSHEVVKFMELFEQTFSSSLDELHS
ncbi:5'-deoxynucleotidase [Acetivibrio ethanolgignens]|uniref:HD/PDEase domain-containing protein n=1 Tax=Acetivibrio ethanolgignens TaxID=290052 RepID=A0A0V8QEY2_9FIRM|nr:5'-deoxynucleotidase [Acetivibrio ethanolgignens]KSV59153.1 hypothetical protein ASU35_10375 [Acetivibrio ethanolgignens]